MPYYLHVYSLPKGAVPPTRHEADCMPDYIRAHGRKMGEIPFSAGESTLFAAAVEELTGVSIFELFNGSVQGIEPTGDGSRFGALTVTRAAQAIREIDSFLDPSDSGMPSGKKDRELSNVSQKFSFDPIDARRRMKLLRDLLSKSLGNGGAPAAIYE